MSILKNSWRQGDICGLPVDNLPEGLEQSKTNVLLQEGSGGNPHTFKGGQFYPLAKDNVLGYLVADKTKIFHVEHNPKGDLIQDGVYQIIRQNEDTHEGLKPVID